METLAESNTSDLDNCSICLTSLGATNSVKTLKCKHQFHTKCINEWFEIKNVCPLCNEAQPTPLQHIIYMNSYHTPHTPLIRYEQTHPSLFQNTGLNLFCCAVVLIVIIILINLPMNG